MRHFYMVWNPRAGAPSYRHEEYASAVKEARRLAQANPGQEFIVLGALTIVRLRDPVEVVNLDGPLTVPAQMVPDDDLPF